MTISYVGEQASSCQEDECPHQYCQGFPFKPDGYPGQWMTIVSCLDNEPKANTVSVLFSPDVGRATNIPLCITSLPPYRRLTRILVLSPAVMPAGLWKGNRFRKVFLARRMYYQLFL